jgi:hypothetical protein
MPNVSTRPAKHLAFGRLCSLSVPTICPTASAGEYGGFKGATAPFVPKAIENQSITWIELRGSPSRKLFRPARRDSATSAPKACLALLAKLDAPDENTICLRD